MLRCSAYQKPVSFYRAAQTSESGIRRGVLFGIFPGVARVKESQRPLYKKYMPPLKAAAEAGWEPVTHARTGRRDVMIERFGGNEKSPATVYLALYNNSDAATKTVIRVDTAKLGWNTVAQVRELIQARPVRLTRGKPAARISLRITPREALILRLKR